MAQYIATVTTGLEAVGAEELETSFGIDSANVLSGAVLFEGPDPPSAAALELIGRLNRWSRGLDRIGLLVAAGNAKSVDECYELVIDVDYTPLIAAAQSFAVRPARRGTHDFQSPDIGRAVGQAVIDAYRRAAGVGLAVSLREPEVILRAELIDDSFRAWVDTTGDLPLYRRGYRRQLHPASLRASLAHSMLRLSGWRGEPLLDPMAGIGTIPIEAALYAAGLSTTHLRTGGFAFENFAWADAPDKNATASADLSVGGVGRAYSAPLIPDPTATDILGLELYSRHVDGARLNLAAAGAPPGVRIERGNAERLDDLVPVGRYMIAVVNPPFGRRVGSTTQLVTLYRRFAAAAARARVVRIVSLAERAELLSDALSGAGYRVVRELAVLYGELPAHVIIAELEP